MTDGQITDRVARKRLCSSSTPCLAHGTCGNSTQATFAGHIVCQTQLVCVSHPLSSGPAPGALHPPRSAEQRPSTESCKLASGPRPTNGDVHAGSTAFILPANLLPRWAEVRGGQRACVGRPGRWPQVAGPWPTDTPAQRASTPGNSQTPL